MMCERAISRRSHGKVISEHQSVQNYIADSYVDWQMLRLLVLQTAWKIDNSSAQEARTDIAACKFTAAKVLREVVWRAQHVHGALGVTDLTPLQGMWNTAPYMSIMDGPDEVHRVTVSKNLLANYTPHEGLFPTEYIPGKRRAAREQFQPIIDADPELKEYVAEMDQRGRRWG
jgi:alkylation response protein AidB-like acyl-CoA dehydrogenase